MSATKATVEAMPWTCRRCGKTMPLRDQPAHLDKHGAELSEAEQIEAQG